MLGKKRQDELYREKTTPNLVGDFERLVKVLVQSREDETILTRTESFSDTKMKTLFNHHVTLWNKKKQYLTESEHQLSLINLHLLSMSKLLQDEDTRLAVHAQSQSSSQSSSKSKSQYCLDLQELLQCLQQYQQQLKRPGSTFLLQKERAVEFQNTILNLFALLKQSCQWNSFRGYEKLLIKLGEEHVSKLCCLEKTGQQLESLHHRLLDTLRKHNLSDTVRPHSFKVDSHIIDGSLSWSPQNAGVVVGLWNYGVTCFVNAVIQLLAHTPAIAQCTQCTSNWRTDSPFDSYAIIINRMLQRKSQVVFLCNFVGCSICSLHLNLTSHAFCDM